MEKIKELNNIFKSYNIFALCKNYNETNNYCYYDVQLCPRTRIKDIERYSNEIGLALRSYGKPSISLLSELGIIRLEFFRNSTNTISLFDYMSNAAPISGGLKCLMGQNTRGEKLWLDLMESPHLLVSGTTGSGKSTILHTIIGNLLNYHDAHILMMDPKNIEFCNYNNIKDDVIVASSYNDCLHMLDRLCDLMESRYELLRNRECIDSLFPIVVIIDEFADLIMQDINKEFYTKLCKLSQKCRAAKINIILATQRPSVDIISGTIKANFPTRIACRVSSGADSKVILDSTGAENLFGKGDSFLKNNSGKLIRFQAAFSTPEEVCKYFVK